MKTADIIPRTVIYATARPNYRGPDRLVVLSIDIHRYGQEEITSGEYVTTLRPRPNERAGRRGSWRMVYGMPALYADHRGAGAPTDDELLAAAAALDETLDGPVPAVPAGISIKIIRPQDVRSTWSDYIEAAARAAARAEYLAGQAVLAAGEQAEAQAVLDLLKRYDVDTAALRTTKGLHGNRSIRVGVMDWAELRTLLEALRDGILNEVT